MDSTKPKPKPWQQQQQRHTPPPSQKPKPPILRCTNCWSINHKLSQCPSPYLPAPDREALRLDLGLPLPWDAVYSRVLNNCSADNTLCFNCWTNDTHTAKSCKQRMRLSNKKREDVRVMMGVEVGEGWRKMLREDGVKEITWQRRFKDGRIVIMEGRSEEAPAKADKKNREDGHLRGRLKVDKDAAAQGRRPEFEKRHLAHAKHIEREEAVKYGGKEVKVKVEDETAGERKLGTSFGGLPCGYHTASNNLYDVLSPEFSNAPKQSSNSQRSTSSSSFSQNTSGGIHQIKREEELKGEDSDDEVLVFKLTIPEESPTTHKEEQNETKHESKDLPLVPSTPTISSGNYYSADTVTRESSAVKGEISQMRTELKEQFANITEQIGGIRGGINGTNETLTHHLESISSNLSEVLNIMKEQRKERISREPGRNSSMRGREFELRHSNSCLDVLHMDSEG